MAAIYSREQLRFCRISREASKHSRLIFVPNDANDSRDRACQSLDVEQIGMQSIATVEPDKPP